MNIRYKLFLTLLLSLFIKFSDAQEITVGLSNNLEIKKFLKENPNYERNKSRTSLELPFWDDFSDSNIFPKTELWEDDNVLINSNLVEEAPTIGVATFDAIDSEGNLYDEADYNQNISADTLTSNPINLDYPGNNTIYLSFFYEAQGLGDAPEQADSLILEFLAPETTTWHRVWFSEGNISPEFQYVTIPVNNAIYLKNNFQFRFRNWVSFGSNTNPSLIGNCDMWHIDYVFLNKNRTSSQQNFFDIAFVSPMKSLLKDYEAMPWKHFSNSKTKLLASKIPLGINNLNNSGAVIDSLNIYLTDNYGGTSKQKKEAGTYSILPPPNNQTSLNISNSFNFPTNNGDYNTFTLKAQLITNSLDSSQNNTITYKQKFLDYYAYDDGSAEASYGLYGDGTKYGSVAYKFYPEKADNLTAVRMYFTKTINDESQRYFWLNIWSQGSDGKPDQIIYQQEGLRPEYDGINTFHLYELDEAINLSDTFFIGWTQTTSDMLNIGMDFNRKANQNLFYKISDFWRGSSIEGAIMIRPVFGNIITDIAENKEGKITVFPNPTNNFFSIKLNNEDSNKEVNISIFDISGKQIINKNHSLNTPINISNLKKGVYFLQIRTSENEIYNSKIIKI